MPMAGPAPISPLAPKSYPEMPAIDGVRFATGAAGIRYKDRTDVLLVLMSEGTQAAEGTRAGARRQFRQCQRVYRQARRRFGALCREVGRGGDGRARE
jgi:N-acetylglutamate synthase/N-acetylornithine aminotransferase